MLGFAFGLMRKILGTSWTTLHPTYRACTVSVRVNHRKCVKERILQGYKLGDRQQSGAISGSHYKMMRGVGWVERTGFSQHNPLAF